MTNQTKRTKALVAALGVAVAGVSVGGAAEGASPERAPGRPIAAPRDAQFLATFGLGLLNFAATFVGVWLVDRLGRRRLLLLGGAGYVVSLFAASLFFRLGWGVPSAAMVFLFLASHAVGQGTVIWVLVAEVFP